MLTFPVRYGELQSFLQALPWSQQGSCAKDELVLESKFLFILMTVPHVYVMFIFNNYGKMAAP